MANSRVDATMAKLTSLGFNKGSIQDRQHAYLKSLQGAGKKSQSQMMRTQYSTKPVREVILASDIP